MDTLILNKDGQPISLLPLSAVSWQEAIKYIVLDRVTVLEWYDDWIISSPNWETKVPAVMMIKDYIHRKTNPKFNKFNLMMRDKFQCQYCNTPVTKATVTFDHVIPISKGGKTNWENIVASCAPCNSRKGSNLWKPLREPYCPTYFELIKNRKEIPFTIKHPSWSGYIK